MGSMFDSPQPPTMIPPEKPRPVRMPNATDPSIIAAGQRTKDAAMRRKGRLSTLLTDNTQATVGSSGQTLGG